MSATASPRRVAIVGALGRMGRAIGEALERTEGVALAAAVVRHDHPELGQDVGQLWSGRALGVTLVADLKQAATTADAVIDFSVASATASVVEACSAAKTPLLIGTTGLSSETLGRCKSAADVIPVVVAPNTSVGVTVLLHLARRAVELLGDHYDAEIFEMHHRRKVDAPSGTAAALSEVVTEAKGFDASARVYGRKGTVGPRKREEIGVMTLRGGDVIGEHTLFLSGPGERLELTHRAQDRHLFALGALRAAKWLAEATRTPGLYSMADVIGVDVTGLGPAGG